MLHLDSPTQIGGDDGVFVVVRGWYAGKQAATRIEACLGTARFSCAFDSRPDVAAVYAQYQSTGFVAVVNLLDGTVDLSGTVELQIVVNGGMDTASFRLPVDRSLPQAIATARQAEARKNAWLKQQLPARLGYDGKRPLWHVSDELKKALQLDPTSNISAHRYDDIAKGIIADVAARDGMVLDCGAGLRHEPNAYVVTSEIVDYPSTDVVCPNEDLPFADNSFDAVFSLNVLEHVADPFKSAAELLRVVTPGGRIYAVAPLLQPEHGYPHHFYNMTREGMRRLFERPEAGLPGVDVQRQWVSRAGEPMATLHWFLNSYLRGLPEKERAQFSKLRVSDIVAKLPHDWNSEGVVTALSDAARWELACTTSIVLTKKA